MKNKERALAHLRSALRYEKRGLENKARAHFGRAMHYGGVGLADLPPDMLRKIIDDVMEGDQKGESLLNVYLASRGTGATTLDAILYGGGVAGFVEKPADQMRKSPFYPFYLVTLHATAKRPTIDLVALLVEYNKSGVRGTDIASALRELRITIISKWYLMCPYRFHDIVDILHDTRSNEETKGVCSKLLEDFISYLSGPSKITEHTVLHRPEIIAQIRLIKEGSFKPAAVTDANIYDLVRRYGTQQDLVPDAFYGPLCLWKTGQAKNMVALFTDLQWREEWDVRLWDTRGVKDMYAAFQNCNGLLAGVEHWSVMSAENTRLMFFGAAGFDRDISRWDTSNVKDMGYMFNGAIAFNRPVGNWDTRTVTNMEGMFRNAAAFNQPIGKWDTRNVTNMSFMFADAVAFNQNIRGWNTTNVETTHHMYTGATAMEEKHKTAEVTGEVIGLT
jgi:surface protein